MPTMGERIRHALFWLCLFGMPVMALMIVAHPWLLIPGTIAYGGLLVWLRPRNE